MNDRTRALVLLLIVTGCSTREEKCEQAFKAWSDDRPAPGVFPETAAELRAAEEAYPALCLMRSRSDLSCLTSGPPSTMRDDPKCGPALRQLDAELRAAARLKAPPEPPPPLAAAMEEIVPSPAPRPPTSYGSGELRVMGSLDKELIRKVIQRNRAQVRYCYESQLNRVPTLAGKVTIKFIISSLGTVAMASVAASTVNDAQLESCLTTRVKTWIFPKPKGGGIAVVTNPFVFP